MSKSEELPNTINELIDMQNKLDTNIFNGVALEKNQFNDFKEMIKKKKFLIK
jgi:hypothetical protein